MRERSNGRVRKRRLPRFLPHLARMPYAKRDGRGRRRNIREAIGLYIESLVEDGLPIPTEDILNRMAAALAPKQEP